jgi:20S proteasome alpha/beta subunit
MCCAGKGEKLIQTILDEAAPTITVAAAPASSVLSETSSQSNKDQLWDSLHRPSETVCCDLSSDEAEQLIVKAFRAACEREITIGDGIELWICRQPNGFSEQQSSREPTDGTVKLPGRGFRRPFGYHLTRKYIHLPKH